ncbi:MAG: ABC transporter ATP-binding protein [Xanthomonadales bacterium]|nr:ABC transporter ATP-binding protein [Xanthomonadales bacterium]
MNRPALEVAGASRRFGDTPALDGVDLSVAPGEWVALLGANGAGKTTLMRAIADRVALDAGSIRLAGNPAGSPEARERLGIVPQRIAIYPHLSVRENLAVFARIHGVPPARLQERVSEALDWTRLEDRASDAAGTLSGGMQRRLNIACGILHEPALVLMDEPTVGLDVPSREQIHRLLSDLRHRGVAILESTHELETVEASCDRVLIMRAGQVLASGTVGQLAQAGRLTRHRCRVTLASEPAGVQLPAGFRLHGRRIEGQVASIAADLATLLEAISDAGLEVVEVSVDPPDLEDVFVHFTGEPVAERPS